MTDARWLEIERDLNAGIGHLGEAADGFDSLDLEGTDRRAYFYRMGFMHALLAGYSSIENALKRILDVLGEAQPTGSDWHRDLLRRLCQRGPGRPAVFSPELCEHLHTLRRFRHVAMHAYDDFRRDKAWNTVEAARAVVPALLLEFDAFKRAIDPPEDR